MQIKIYLFFFKSPNKKKNSTTFVYSLIHVPIRIYIQIYPYCKIKKNK